MRGTTSSWCTGAAGRRWTCSPPRTGGPAGRPSSCGTGSRCTPWTGRGSGARRTTRTSTGPTGRPPPTRDSWRRSPRPRRPGCQSTRSGRAAATATTLSLATFLAWQEPIRLRTPCGRTRTCGTRRDRTARPDRAVGAADALVRRRVRLAGRCLSARRWSRPWSPSSRAAVRRAPGARLLQLRADAAAARIRPGGRRGQARRPSGRGRVVPVLRLRAVVPRHRGVPAVLRGGRGRDPARRARHPRQRPRDDAGEEQRRGRRGHHRLDRQAHEVRPRQGTRKSEGTGAR